MILDPATDARSLGGFTYLLDTPEGFEPSLTFFFTYASGTIKMQMVTDGEDSEDA